MKRMKRFPLALLVVDRFCMELCLNLFVFLG
jgi:hypothetical protein